MIAVILLSFFVGVGQASVAIENVTVIDTTANETRVWQMLRFFSIDQTFSGKNAVFFLAL